MNESTPVPAKCNGAVTTPIGRTHLALAEIEKERQRQRTKWGERLDQQHVVWLSILMEEVGEAAKEINDIMGAITQAKIRIQPDMYRNTDEMINQIVKEQKIRYLQEVIQVAAVATAMIEQIQEELK